MTTIAVSRRTFRASTKIDAPKEASTAPEEATKTEPRKAGASEEPATEPTPISNEDRAAARARAAEVGRFARYQQNQIWEAHSNGFERGEDGRYTFNGTREDDRYEVTENPQGDLRIENLDSDEIFVLPQALARRGVLIELGAGDDVLKINASVTSTDLEIYGGNGQDHLDASAMQASNSVHMSGGRGRDRLWGGAGDDSLFGGTGKDSIRGGDGADLLDGGSGHDFLNGASGADTVHAGSGADTIYVDSDDVEINTNGPGESGDNADLDLVMTEIGASAAVNVGAEDLQLEYDLSVYETWTEENPDTFQIEGSDDYVARTKADLSALLATPTGRQMLDDLAASGESFSIQDYDGWRSRYRSDSNSVEHAEHSDLAKNPVDDTQRPIFSVSVLAHELVHAHQDINGETHRTFGERDRTEFSEGEWVNNIESDAVGFGYIAPPNSQNHRWHYVAAGDQEVSDNQIREEMGIPKLTSYQGEIRPAVRWVFPWE